MAEPQLSLHACFPALHLEQHTSQRAKPKFSIPHRRRPRGSNPRHWNRKCSYICSQGYFAVWEAARLISSCFPHLILCAVSSMKSGTPLQGHTGPGWLSCQLFLPATQKTGRTEANFILVFSLLCILGFSTPSSQGLNLSAKWPRVEVNSQFHVSFLEAERVQPASWRLPFALHRQRPACTASWNRREDPGKRVCLCLEMCT